MFLKYHQRVNRTFNNTVSYEYCDFVFVPGIYLLNVRLIDYLQIRKPSNADLFSLLIVQ